MKPVLFPAPCFLNSANPMIIALGADLKGSLAVMCNGEIEFRTGFEDISNLTEFQIWQSELVSLIEEKIPDVVVVDKHPLYLSRKFGQSLAKRTGAKLIEVQHHYAHSETAQFLSHSRLLSCHSRKDSQSQDSQSQDSQSQDSQSQDSQSQSGNLSSPVPINLSPSKQGSVDYRAIDSAGLRESSLQNVPYLSIVLDGTGFGDDGTIWGCELLFCKENGSFDRIGHLEAVNMPGGDSVIFSPWKMASAWLTKAGFTENEIKEIIQNIEQNELDAVIQISKSNHCLSTSSAGRLFDAAAAILGLYSTVLNQAEAPVKLEEIAWSAQNYFELPVSVDNDLLIFSRAIRKLIELKKEKKFQNELSLSFHFALIQGIRLLVNERAPKGIKLIAFSGGCFLNSILREQLKQMLISDGYEVSLPEPIECTDAFISLGQVSAAYKQIAISTK